MYRRRYGDVKNLIVQGIKTIVECIIFTSDSCRVTIFVAVYFIVLVKIVI